MEYEINKLVSHTKVHGEIILANMETGLYFSVDGSGKQIWEALVKGETVVNIIDTLTERYQTNKDHVSKDVYDFLHHLECRKFIQKVGKRNAI
ncbi:MAG: PqqD family protein [Gammaproteobacteria bacterium]|nr:PqqD family protein [Gammaproteobacteria bacterium]